MLPAFAEPVVQGVGPPITGLVDTPNLDVVPETAATRLINFNLDRLGLQRRRGRVQIGDRTASDQAGNWLFEFRRSGAATQILKVGDDRLHKLSAGAWLGVVSGANPATAADAITDTGGTRLIIGAQLGGRLYFCPFTTAGKWYDGTQIQPWGWTAGALPVGVIGAAAGGGSLTTGKFYTFVYTYYNPTTGAETNPAPAPTAVSVTTPNLTLNITVPANGAWTAASGYTKYRIYRTAGGASAATVGSTYKFEKEGVYAGIAVAETISVADGDLTTVVANDNDPPPAGLEGVIRFGNRLVAWKAGDIYWSKDGNANAWPTVNTTPVSKDGGYVVVGLAELNGLLYAGLERGIYRLTPRSTSASFTFSSELVTADFGMASHHSIIYYGARLWWLDDKGAVSFDGSLPRNIADPAIRSTYRYYANIPGSIASAVGVHDYQPDKPYLRWVVRGTGGNNTHLIYDVSREAWMLEECTAGGGANGTSDQYLAIINAGAAETWHVYTVDSGGYAYRLRTDESNVEVFADNGQAFTSTFRSKWFGNGKDSLLPLYTDVHFEISRAGQGTGTWTAKIYRDHEGGTSDTTSISLYATGELSRTVRCNWNAARCRRFMIEFTYTGSAGELQIIGFDNILQQEGRMLLGSA